MGYARAGLLGCAKKKLNIYSRPAVIQYSPTTTQAPDRC